MADLGYALTANANTTVGNAVEGHSVNTDDRSTDVKPVVGPRYARTDDEDTDAKNVIQSVNTGKREGSANIVLSQSSNRQCNCS